MIIYTRIMTAGGSTHVRGAYVGWCVFLKYIYMFLSHPCCGAIMSGSIGRDTPGVLCLCGLNGVEVFVFHGKWEEVHAGAIVIHNTAALDYTGGLTGSVGDGDGVLREARVVFLDNKGPLSDGTIAPVGSLDNMQIVYAIVPNLRTAEGGVREATTSDCNALQNCVTEALDDINGKGIATIAISAIGCYAFGWSPSVAIPHILIALSLWASPATGRSIKQVVLFDSDGDICHDFYDALKGACGFPHYLSVDTIFGSFYDRTGPPGYSAVRAFEDAMKPGGTLAAEAAESIAASVAYFSQVNDDLGMRLIANHIIDAFKDSASYEHDVVVLLKQLCDQPIPARSGWVVDASEWVVYVKTTIAYFLGERYPTVTVMVPSDYYPIEDFMDALAAGSVVDTSVSEAIARRVLRWKESPGGDGDDAARRIRKFILDKSLEKLDAVDLIELLRKLPSLPPGNVYEPPVGDVENFVGRLLVEFSSQRKTDTKPPPAVKPKPEKVPTEDATPGSKKKGPPPPPKGKKPAPGPTSAEPGPKPAAEKYLGEMCTVMLEKVKISVVHNTVTNVTASAIVNAANEDLLHGGGIAEAICAAAGGNAFQTASNALGRVPVGTAKYQKITDKKSKLWRNGVMAIVHATAPNRNDGDTHTASYYIDGMKNCVTAALDAGSVKPGIESVAIPALGSNLFGWTPSAAIELIVTAIIEWINGHKRSTITSVILFDFKPDICLDFSYALHGMTDPHGPFRAFQQILDPFPNYSDGRPAPQPKQPIQNKYSQGSFLSQPPPIKTVSSTPAAGPSPTASSASGTFDSVGAAASPAKNPVVEPTVGPKVADASHDDTKEPLPPRQKLGSALVANLAGMMAGRQSTTPSKPKKHDGPKKKFEKYVPPPFVYKPQPEVGGKS